MCKPKHSMGLPYKPPQIDPQSTTQKAVSRQSGLAVPHGPSCLGNHERDEN